MALQEGREHGRLDARSTVLQEAVVMLVEELDAVYRELIAMKAAKVASPRKHSDSGRKRKALAEWPPARTPLMACSELSGARGTHWALPQQDVDADRQAARGYLL